MKTIKGQTIIVEAELDRCGNLIIKHKSTKTDLYLQQDTERQQFIDDYIPKKYHRDLDNGWTIRYKMDKWTFEQINDLMFRDIKILYNRI